MTTLPQIELPTRAIAQPKPILAAPHLVHFPTPGDHYSAATGSAVMTVIYEFSRCHDIAGGKSSVLVATGTRHDYPIGECVEFAGRQLPNRKHKLVDSALGLAGLGRHFDQRFYRPAAEALDRSFDGVLLLHNAAGAVTMFAKRFPNAQVYLWPHNGLFGTYSRRELCRVVGATAGVICVSRFIAKGIEKRLEGVHVDKLKIVNNGVDTSRFRPASKSPDSDIPTILFVGRVTAQKAPDLIIRAAAKLVSPTRRFKVRIVGNSGFSAKDPLTPYEQELRTLAAPLGDVVEFQPFVDRNRLLSEFAAASIYCVPSNWDDPCPLTVGEGLASGLPCVISTRGGIPEIAEDAALYFTPPDIDQLVARFEQLLDNPAERSEWGRKARARATQITWANQYQVLRQQLS